MASPFVCVADYQRFAEENMPELIREFVNGGSYYEVTYVDNVAAFKGYRFRPRYMVDVSEVSMTTTLLGQPVRYPVGVSPMSPCKSVHLDGEPGLARACQAEGVCFGLSMTATASLEEIGHAAPDSLRWFQIEMLSDRDMMRRLVARAEKAGFKAIVLTVDCVTKSIRYTNLRNQDAINEKFTLDNFKEELAGGKPAPENQLINTGDNYLQRVWLSADRTWKDVKWLKSISPLPVVIKGIVTGHDARQALDHGADAIWVSNHGGRKLDCVPATIDALGEVCQAVGGRAEVYLDGGVRSGLDVLKALSRGARAVFVGRAALWGLAKDGCKGAKEIFNILKEELKDAMKLAGVTDVQHVPSDLVVHQSYYSRM